MKINNIEFPKKNLLGSLPLSHERMIEIVGYEGHALADDVGWVLIDVQKHNRER
jgi:hypothetical protein